MPRHILYAYIDGCDLHEIADAIEPRIRRIVEEHGWSRPTHYVNERHPPEPTDGPGDLPGWDLGVTHDLPEPGSEPNEWFEEVLRLAELLAPVSSEFGRSFVIGILDSATGIAEDLDDISAGQFDPVRLRAIIGDRPPPRGAV